MQRLLIGTLTAILAGTMAGCSNELPDAGAPIVPDDNNLITVTARAGMPQGGADTRVGLEEKEGESKLAVTWETSGESFSVLQGEGTVTPSTFTQTTTTEEKSTTSAVFEGKITSTSGNFYAFYPALAENSKVSATSISLDMGGEQTGKLDPDKIYMYSSSTCNDNTLSFQFAHLTSILKLTLKFKTDAQTSDPDDFTIVDWDKQSSASKASTVTRTDTEGGGNTTGQVTNVAFTGGLTSATVDITKTTTNGGSAASLTPAYTGKATGTTTLTNTEGFALTNGMVTIYLHLLPSTLANANVTATYNGKNYSGTLSGTMEAGKMYTKTVEMDVVEQLDGTTTATEPTTGNGTEGSPYEIASAENLKWLIQQETGSSGVTKKGEAESTPSYYKLTANIEVNTETWTPIGNSATPFDGHFDGNGHIISGTLTEASDASAGGGDGGNGDVTISRAASTPSDEPFGFFGYCGANSEIKNLHLTATVTQGKSEYVGAIAGRCDGTIIGCSNGGEVSGGAGYSIGGIVGWYNSSNNLTNCTNTGKVGSTSGNNLTISIGGIVGYAEISAGSSGTTNSLTISGCTNRGAVIGGENTNTSYNLSNFTPSINTSGIAGNINLNNYTNITIKRCINYGAVTGGSMTITPITTVIFTNGIALTRTLSTSATTTSIQDCINYGTITGGKAYGCHEGGIGNFSTKTNSLLRCANYGEVIGGTIGGTNDFVGCTGGIIGFSWDNCAIHLCHNGAVIKAGTVTSSTATSRSTGSDICTGGLVGCFIRTGFGSTLTIYDCCTNTGTPTDFVGSNSNFTLTQCNGQH